VNARALVAVTFVAALGAGSADTPVAVAQAPEGRIAFQSTRTGDSEIWIANADGSEQRNLTSSPDTEDSTPALSPDGSQIAFVRADRVANRLWIMDADGAGQRLLAPRTRGAFAPVWSPNGDRIAFSRLVHGNWDIYVASVDGAVKRITRHPAAEIDVSWNPDGDRLVLDRIARGRSDLWTVPADGGRARRLTRTRRVAELNPDWAPNGDEIAYDAFVARRYDLFALDVGTLKARRLTRDRADDGDPEWDPTGTYLAYRRGLGPDYEIARVDATGSGHPTNISRERTGIDLAPSWGPASAGGAAAGVWATAAINWNFQCDAAWPGTSGPDGYVGTPQVNRMCGGGAGDTIKGRARGDWLSGGDGHDTLKGEDGDDRLKARADGIWDSLWGGPGTDAALIDASDVGHLHAVENVFS
jgi:dipeptidyl aminopeptidase/acylaminoacyl peptidase